MNIFANEYTKKLSLLHLISDLQTGSYKTGLWKSEWINHLPDLEIIDITHEIKLNNTIEAAFVGRQLLYNRNTSNIVHFKVGNTPQWIVYQHEMNLFILPNNGLISMLFDDIRYEEVRMVDKGTEITAAVNILKGNKNMYPPASSSLVLRYNKQATVTENMIVAECIHTDKHGNCYFNLNVETFGNFLRQRPFSIRIQHYTGHLFTEVGRSLQDADEGEAIFRFSSSGFLKLQINMGNARQLFRIKEETKIIIEAK